LVLKEFVTQYLLERLLGGPLVGPRVVDTKKTNFKDIRDISFIHLFIHLVVCLTTFSKPLPK
jgi:hypothetical protein